MILYNCQLSWWNVSWLLLSENDLYIVVTLIYKYQFTFCSLWCVFFLFLLKPKEVDPTVKGAYPFFQSSPSCHSPRLGLSHGLWWTLLKLQIQTTCHLEGMSACLRALLFHPLLWWQPLYVPNMAMYNRCHFLSHQETSTIVKKLQSGLLHHLFMVQIMEHRIVPRKKT